MKGHDGVPPLGTIAERYPSESNLNMVKESKKKKQNEKKEKEMQTGSLKKGRLEHKIGLVLSQRPFLGIGAVLVTQLHVNLIAITHEWGRIFYFGLSTWIMKFEANVHCGHYSYILHGPNVCLCY